MHRAPTCQHIKTIEDDATHAGNGEYGGERGRADLSANGLTVPSLVTPRRPGQAPPGSPSIRGGSDLVFGDLGDVFGCEAELGE